MLKGKVHFLIMGCRIVKYIFLWLWGIFVQSAEKKPDDIITVIVTWKLQSIKRNVTIECGVKNMQPFTR